jgi:hypothetical protein
MPAKNHYDAVLVGLDLATLLTGALLSKRGFRVLVVGQGSPRPSYKVGELRLPRAPFSMRGHGSPALFKVLSELAVRPLVQRRMRPLAPSFQAVLPGHRLDFGVGPEAFSHELAREFPGARRAFEALTEQTTANDRRFDALLSRDLLWPPQGFFERREFSRALHQTQLDGPLERSRVHEELDDAHPLARVIDAVLRFSDGSAFRDGLSARALRLWSAQLHASELAEGGLPGLFELLLASIRTHNGTLRLTDRVHSLTVRRGALESFQLLPSDEQIGCHFMLWGLPLAKLSAVLPDPGELAQLYEEVGEPRATFARFTMNVVLDPAALPEGMARNVMLFGEHEPLWLEAQRTSDGKLAILSVESRIPMRDERESVGTLAQRRERMLTDLNVLSPFLHEHLRLIDSPHDGRPPQSFGERLELAPEDAFRRGPETMEMVYAFARPRLQGTAGVHVRTPIKRLLLCNAQVVPGLGLEGTSLTAWSAARVVTRSLNRDWMNRGRWTKVEL